MFFDIYYTKNNDFTRVQAVKAETKEKAIVKFNTYYPTLYSIDRIEILTDISSRVGVI